MIRHWKALDKEITDGDYQFDRTYTGKTTPSQTSKYAMRDWVEHPTSFVEASRKKAKLEELSNNISDRSEAYGTGILSDLLLGERSEVSGKSAIYYIITISWLGFDVRRVCEKSWPIFFARFGLFGSKITSTPNDARKQVPWMYCSDSAHERSEAFMCRTFRLVTNPQCTILLMVSKLAANFSENSINFCSREMKILMTSLPFIFLYCM